MKKKKTEIVPTYTTKPTVKIKVGNIVTYNKYTNLHGESLIYRTVQVQVNEFRLLDSFYMHTIFTYFVSFFFLSSSFSQSVTTQYSYTFCRVVFILQPFSLLFLNTLANRRCFHFVYNVLITHIHNHCVNRYTLQNAYVSFSPFCRSFMRALFSSLLFYSYFCLSQTIHRLRHEHIDTSLNTIELYTIHHIHRHVNAIFGCITCSLHVYNSPPTLKKVLVSDNICD